MEPECTVQDLKAMMAASPPPLLLDVREPWELDICRLPGAVNIPLGNLHDRMPELPKDADIIALCHHGRRSLLAVLVLREHGFMRSSSVKGGIDEWSNKIDPSVKKY